MPVTRISASVDWSVYSGAGAWIGRVSVALIGPASSTGSPMTFMMRPSVPSPTGTAIGRPVSVTSWPRTRPSVASIAIVRTVDSPRCWATSSTRRLLPFLVSSELRIAGKWPSNCTSTTAPMAWVTRPIWLAAVAMKLSPCSPKLYCGELNWNVAIPGLKFVLRLFHNPVDHGRNLALDEGHQFGGGGAHLPHRRLCNRLRIEFRQRVHLFDRQVLREGDAHLGLITGHEARLGHLRDERLLLCLARAGKPCRDIGSGFLHQFGRLLHRDQTIGRSQRFLCLRNCGTGGQHPKRQRHRRSHSAAA